MPTVVVLGGAWTSLSTPTSIPSQEVSRPHLGTLWTEPQADKQPPGTPQPRVCTLGAGC